jgi:hypothetical protein
VIIEIVAPGGFYIRKECAGLTNRSGSKDIGWE